MAFFARGHKGSFAVRFRAQCLPVWKKEDVPSSFWEDLTSKAWKARFLELAKLSSQKAEPGTDPPVMERQFEMFRLLRVTGK
jgi:hypothetical protein